MNRTAWLQDTDAEVQGRVGALGAAGAVGAGGWRYEEAGLEGLIDRRLGKASAKRVPVDEIAWMVEAYRKHHQGWTVQHFHEHLQAHPLGLHLDEDASLRSQARWRGPGGAAPTGADDRGSRASA